MQTIDKQILKKFTAGEKAAFDMIYSAYSPGMYSICLRYTRCRDDAQDVLQEAFIKVYEKRSYYNTEMSIGAWIKTITIRTALNYIRQNYKLILTDSEQMFEQDATVNEETTVSSRKAELLKVLQELPDGYRTVFHLYTIDNLTHKEIAEHLGISEGTSKSQYFKAKKMIHEKLELTPKYNEAI